MGESAMCPLISHIVMASSSYPTSRFSMPTTSGLGISKAFPLGTLSIMKCPLSSPCLWVFDSVGMVTDSLQIASSEKRAFACSHLIGLALFPYIHCVYRKSCLVKIFFFPVADEYADIKVLSQFKVSQSLNFSVNFKSKVIDFSLVQNLKIWFIL